MCTPFNKKNNKVYPIIHPIVCGTKRMSTILHVPITDCEEGIEYIPINKSDQNKVSHHIFIQEKKNNL
jgi:hypothetical protein